MRRTWVPWRSIYLLPLRTQSDPWGTLPGDIGRVTVSNSSSAPSPPPPTHTHPESTLRLEDPLDRNWLLYTLHAAVSIDEKEWEGKLCLAGNTLCLVTPCLIISPPPPHRRTISVCRWCLFLAGMWMWLTQGTGIQWKRHRSNQGDPSIRRDGKLGRHGDIHKEGSHHGDWHDHGVTMVTYKERSGNHDDILWVGVTMVIYIEIEEWVSPLAVCIVRGESGCHSDIHRGQLATMVISIHRGSAGRRGDTGVCWSPWWYASREEFGVTIFIGRGVWGSPW